MINNSPQIDCVPQNDRCHEEIQSTSPMSLILIRSVAYFTQPVEEHCPARRVFLFTFAKPYVAAPTQFGILQPV